jgi:hypothetical protein
MALNKKLLIPFVYISSLFLFFAGAAIMWWFLRDHKLIVYFMIGYALLSIFFLSMKLFLFKTISKKIE